MSVEWLDRRASAPLPNYTLCLSEKDYFHIFKRLGEKPIAEWVSPGSHGTTHTLYDKAGNICCIVCMKDTKGMEAGAVYGLIIHEAVHVWQKYCLSIGETNPSTEFEAYSIQWICQQMLYSFDKQRMAAKCRQ